MDLFIRGIPNDTTSEQLCLTLKVPLAYCDIFNFQCAKIIGKPNGKLHIGDEVKARTFLKRYTNGLRFYPNNVPIFITRDKHQMNGLAVKNLLFEEKRRDIKDRMAKKRSTYLPPISIERVLCGVWNVGVVAGRKVIYFKSYCEWEGYHSGNLVFGSRIAAITLPKRLEELSCKRFDISYNSVHNMVIGDSTTRYVSFTLKHPPRMYELVSSKDRYEGSLQQAFQHLGLSEGIYGSNAPILQQRDDKREKKRLCGLDSFHKRVAGQSFVYRVKITEKSWMRFVGLVGKASGLPRRTYLNTYQAEHSGFDVLLIRDKAIDHLNNISKLPYSVKFQLLKLLHSLLPPSMVLEMLPAISSMSSKFGPQNVSKSLSALTLTLPYLAPGESVEHYNVKNTISFLEDSCLNIEDEQRIYEGNKVLPHMVMVYRVQVTPTTITPSGPYPETLNRVLRRYGTYTDCFLRVTFADEDGDQLWNEHRTDTSLCYKRFATILKTQIPLLGKSFEFLGFSHSSLRTQTCWYMTAFNSWDTGNLMSSDNIINELGNFKEFTNPAKAAARLGQAFTDTTTSVKIAPKAIAYKSDIERNGFCFSDGCGTISTAILGIIKRAHKKGKCTRSTVFQIRYGGAKGMLSLDASLPDDLMVLRPSMAKFEARGQLDIEICGTANSPSPAFLNKQLIKILEDLGVRPQVFKELLENNIRRLEYFGSEPLAAAFLLESGHISDVANIANLIRRLHSLKLQIFADDFLSKMVKMAGVVALQELKYRARIPLENDWDTWGIKGLTLYGIMDETGFLMEGQIFCPVQIHKGLFRVLEGRCVITRAPCMFAGDVQVVEAVCVPENNLLSKLRNVVVFPQKGTRDLASQLSGGDLDGDKFSVIFDTRLIPPKTVSPALIPKAPQANLGRYVNRLDMADWFCKFMQNDCLGQISNLHLQMADFEDMGTLSASCEELAYIAAKAVDFSKSGIPIDAATLGPYYKRVGPYRPDFMSASPRIQLAQHDIALEGEADPDDQDPYAALDQVPRKKFVESPKILGVLYRSINEQDFLRNLNHTTKENFTAHGRNNILQEALILIKNLSSGIQYEHHLNFARSVRKS